MGKRKFKLPGEEDLNKDQDKVYDLPEDGQFLIVGGPGTGKSVVALLRALKYHKNNDYVFLTYNRVLNSATNQIIDINLINWTIQSWFYKLQYKLTKEFMPEIEKHRPDYEELIRKFVTVHGHLFIHKIIHLAVIFCEKQFAFRCLMMYSLKNGINHNIQETVSHPGRCRDCQADY